MTRDTSSLLPIIALVLMAPLNACGTSSATESEPEAAAQAEVSPTAAPEEVTRAVEATPVGLVGAIVDLRSELPAGVEGPSELILDRSIGNVVALGPRGNHTKLRFNVWSASEPGEGEPYLAAYAVEVYENPERANVTYRQTAIDPHGVHLEVTVEWGTRDHPRGLILRGRQSVGGAAVFEPE